MSKQHKFTSISSDNNLFDFDMMVGRVIKSRGITKGEMKERVREYFIQHNPDFNEIEISVLVVQALQMKPSYEYLILMLDVLGVQLEMILVEPPAKN